MSNPLGLLGYVDPDESEEEDDDEEAQLDTALPTAGAFPVACCVRLRPERLLVRDVVLLDCNRERCGRLVTGCGAVRSALGEART